MSLSADPAPVVSPAQAAMLAALPEPALITLAQWERGGTGIVYANPRFCELTGYTAEELAGQNTRLLHGTKTDLSLLQHGLREDASGQQRGEGWLCRKDGHPFFARWSFSPLLPDADGGPRLLIAVYQDQSELKRLREALLSTQKLDTVGMLASGVAHDFNNLLSVINGYCEIVSGKIVQMPEAQKDIHEIHRAGLKAAAIARQILEFSRRQETDVKVVNFNTLIREIAEILRRAAGDEVKLELRLASDLGNARIDPTQFQQVLLNLCFNAREAMQSGGQITLRTYNHRVAQPGDRRVPEMANGNYAVLRITGTGLGLATVFGIIRQHNGHIAVQSTPGSGTTFDIFLPETAEPEETTVIRLASLPATRGTETLLLIEEDTVLRKMIAGILATDGYTVTDMATVAEAVPSVAIGELQPQLVLAPCDHQAVADLVRLLHEKNPALRVISISAEPPETILPGLPAKALLHLPKPFALSTLITGVRQLLDAGQR
jgi:two-component system, cell cycle sensor histidine kinase and response regulator CckA